MNYQTLKLEYKLISKYLKRLLYFLALLLISIFLYKMGCEPWVIAFESWKIFIAMVVVAGFGVFVQSHSFRLVCSDECIKIGRIRLILIWAYSAVISVVAPFFAGVATRTALLAKAGISLPVSLKASLAQVWIGIETVSFFGVIAFLNFEWKYSNWVVSVFTILWGGMYLVRVWQPKRIPVASYILNLFIGSAKTKKTLRLYPWYLLQALCMTATYYLSFNAMSSALDLPSCMVLATATIFVSLIAMVPNGLGVTDALWVAMAQQNGFPLDEAVAVAILIRFSHFTASSLISASGIFFSSNKSVSSV